MLKRDSYNGKSEYCTYNDEQHCIRHYYNLTCKECSEVLEEVSEDEWLGHVFDSKNNYVFNRNLNSA